MKFCTYALLAVILLACTPPAPPSAAEAGSSSAQDASALAAPGRHHHHPQDASEAGPGPEAAAPPSAATYVAVCQHLAGLGCPEGQDPNCPLIIGKIQDAQLSDLKPNCLFSASTVQAVQACGTVACQIPAKAKSPKPKKK